jgi:hypothetical protein
VSTKTGTSTLNRVLGVLVLMTVLTAFGLLYLRSHSRSPRQVPSTLPQSGIDTVAILVVSSRCGACKAEPAATKVRQRLSSLSEDHVRRYRFIGLSVDTDIAAGLGLLRNFGRFDEISVGSGYLNSIALQYIWQDSVPFAAVPQLLVFERSVQVARSPLRVIRSDGPIERVVGLEAIASWLQERAGER